MTSKDRKHSENRSKSSSPLGLSHRQKVAHLLEGVFDECLTSRQAINRWPCVVGVDASLDTAYQALMHFEADEEQQQTELFYIDAQLELLIQMASYLAKNEALPDYILLAYRKEAQEFKTGYYQDTQVFNAPFRKMARWIKDGIKVALDAFGMAY